MPVLIPEGKKNRIEKIKDEQGKWWESTAGVGKAFMNYFTGLFSAGEPVDLDPCLQNINTRVTKSMNTELMGDFRVEEIDKALFQMAPLKAPSPDGMNACFFQQNWGVVGEEVCRGILEILNTGVMPINLNLTHIALIPKTNNPGNVSEFQPISLCNVLYKLILKVLANRLKKVLPHIISPTHSAFIPGRLITNNILAAYETLHMMHTGRGGKRVLWQ
jgi:hypothetical protein